VRLNTDTALRVSLRRDVRRVTLLRGEAFFEAAHDAARPFIVTADHAEVRAIGTKFDVRRDPQAVRVTLLEGRVQVASETAPHPAILTPNQQLTVTRRGVSAPRAADPAEAAGWTTGRLTFHGVPLADAVAEANRYTRRRIVLDVGPEVARRPVSGVFDAGDTAALAAAVSQLFDLQPRAGPDGMIHLAAPAEKASAG
jgi:transmembrane sensor